MNIGQVDFNGRNADRSNCVTEGDARVRIGRRIEDNDIEFTLGMLDPFDQLTLEVGLAEINGRAEHFRPFSHFCLNLRQSRPAVHARFALAQQIQIGTVKEKDFHAWQAV